jgi:hypothetical protein
MDADDMYGPPDWWIEEREKMDECPNCGCYYYLTNLFCTKCLSNEDKWRLGVL